MPVASAGSLWTKKGANESAMVADLRAQQVGDILTVVVQETASAQSSRRTKTDKSANIKAEYREVLLQSGRQRFPDPQRGHAVIRNGRQQ